METILNAEIPVSLLSVLKLEQADIKLRKDSLLITVEGHEAHRVQSIFDQDIPIKDYRYLLFEGRDNGGFSVQDRGAYHGTFDIGYDSPKGYPIVTFLPERS